MLGILLGWMVLHAKKQEKQIAAASNEIVREAKSSATRVISPKDLDAEASQVNISPHDSGGKKTPVRSAIIHFVIKNHGSVPYHDTMLSLTWVGDGGRVLETQKHLVVGAIEPGGTLTAEDADLDRIPAGSTRCVISIIYSNLGSAEKRTGQLKSSSSWRGKEKTPVSLIANV